MPGDAAILTPRPFRLLGGIHAVRCPATKVPTRTAMIIGSTTAGIAATSRQTRPMAFARRQHNLTILADGNVLATGGESSAAVNIGVDLNHPVFNAELFDTTDETWRTLGAANRVREYHSTAILLPDGRVMTGGGGICAECQRVGYLKRNVEYFEPPYLFRNDGSGEHATRPVIDSAPASASYGTSYSVTSAQAGTIAKVGLSGWARRRTATTRVSATCRPPSPAAVRRSPCGRRRMSTKPRPGTTCCSSPTAPACRRWPSSSSSPRPARGTRAGAGDRQPLRRALRRRGPLGVRAGHPDPDVGLQRDPRAALDPARRPHPAGLPVAVPGIGGRQDGARDRRPAGGVHRRGEVEHPPGRHDPPVREPERMPDRHRQPGRADQARDVHGGGVTDLPLQLTPRAAGRPRNAVAGPARLPQPPAIGGRSCRWDG